MVLKSLEPPSIFPIRAVEVKIVWRWCLIPLENACETMALRFLKFQETAVLLAGLFSSPSAERRRYSSHADSRRGGLPCSQRQYQAKLGFISSVQEKFVIFSLGDDLSMLQGVLASFSVL